MKKITIGVVAIKPKDATQADYDAVKKAGDISVTYLTAIEAIRNSGGLYCIRPEVKAVEIEIQGLKPPSEMSKEELVQELTAWGKPPKKQMARLTIEKFILSLREKAVDMIIDDE